MLCFLVEIYPISEKAAMIPDQVHTIDGVEFCDLNKLWSHLTWQGCVTKWQRQMPGRERATLMLPDLATPMYVGDLPGDRECVHVSMCACMHVYVCVYIYVHTCLCVHTCVHMCGCM